VEVDFSSNTVLITCGGQTNKVKFWDITTNPATNTFTSSVAQMDLCTVYSTTRIGTATTNNKLYYNAVAAGITNLITVNGNSCVRIAFSPNGMYMTAACSDAGGTSGYFINTATSVVSSLLTTGDLYTTSYSGDS
jgi:WD40 repeat protein